RRHTRFSRDWSSDVCSSDLLGIQNEFPDLLKPELIQMRQQKMERRREQTREELMQDLVTGYWVTGWTEEPVFSYEVQGYETRSEIGRASCRERVEIVGVAGS